jgi:rhamnulokinase
MVEKALARMSAEELYRHTGLTVLPIHTLFQLLSLRLSGSPALEAAARLLMMPDLLGYFLTGVPCGERTDAITTQLYDPRGGAWSRVVFDAFDLSLSIMPDLVDPGTVLGELRESVQRLTGLSRAVVVAVCHHDTGSAVAAVPAEGSDWAFISSGTWSVLGTLSDEVVTSAEALAARVCNELTLGSLFLCRNIMGLWLLQQARASWQRDGQAYSYEELVRLAEQAPEGGPVIYPDDLSFLAPPDMPQALRDYCVRTGQTPPDGPAAMTRCILESLALSYREGLERLAALRGRPFQALHVVGGGSQNSLLCQFTADATGLPVLAGPVEATVAGNVLVQALAQGELGSPAEVREVVRRSFDLVEYAPRRSEDWEARYAKYRELADQGGGQADPC